MLTFTDAQLVEWLSPVFWPFLRVLALFGAMPVIAQRTVPYGPRLTNNWTEAPGALRTTAHN